ncbi:MULTISPECIES: hypothetical protein [unclassified Microbacterium]|uniref:hypothetical protein n=1 Tax=unclassified Microbacterium TaxID=2609290 RepID=UPI001605237F|nr:MULTISPECIES: hypothetical protein [unclassified Microbacterium]QNA93925.1 hypothetical protein G4G29_19590 [Microbacterium sp. Se63.02b]QYM64239.1 hypothetical protein K1X59_19645 [Microbacterium sp. Se5.02b]
MSALEIDHGGAIAVDTGQLRDVGARMRAVTAQYEEARDAVGRALRAAAAQQTACPHLDASALQRSDEHLEALRTELDSACTGVMLMADAFEVVELRARAEALALTDAAAADAASARADRLVAADGRVADMADYLVAGWEERRFDGLGEQFDAGGCCRRCSWPGRSWG